MKKIFKKSLLPYFLILIVAIYIIGSALLPQPTVAATLSTITIPDIPTTAIKWPNYGQQAVGVQGFGVLATNGEQKSVPIASIAKTVLAYSVLKEKPLKIGEQGPAIIMTDADIKFYHDYLAQNGSIVPVNVGESLTEYQLLQALLIPSGDNIADTLAVWAFSSVENYLTYANKMVADLGMTKTVLSDSSGISPKTVSSAQDLVILGDNLMKEPVLAEIVSQSKITLPVLGTASNYNTILGHDNIIGIKTGNTDEAGGCFLFASKTKIGTQDTTIIGAILGASTRDTALQDTLNFIENNSGIFQYTTLIHEGDKVGSYVTLWGQSVDAVSSKDYSLITINGEKITSKTNLNTINKPQKRGYEVGNVEFTANNQTVTVPILLGTDLLKPSYIWKVFHPHI